MLRRLPRAVAIAVSTMLAGSGLHLSGAPALATPHEPAGSIRSAEQSSADLKERIARLPGVVSVAERAAPRGYRFFAIGFRQPKDHKRPSAGSFTQRLTLLHKDTTRPMVMFTSGYSVAQSPLRSEPTQIVDGNQLSMEHRFFEASRPQNANWPRQLTIWQAATDQHTVIQAFTSLYPKNWLTTGASKGGMTATYHRRFYPGDVNGTVPYVAPNDVDNDHDVYGAFLDKVGSTPQCRNNLRGLQRRVLGKDRAWFTRRTDEAAKVQHLTYHTVGNKGVAFEASVIDMYFAFWQYQPESECANVPNPSTASNEEIWNFFNNVSPMTGGDDASLGYFLPYYYQASYQLGWPEPYEKGASGLLKFPGTGIAPTFVPKSLRPTSFDRAAMPDIDRWVRTRSHRMLYIYGANDPWSAEPFDCGRLHRGRECARFSVPRGTHGARIAQLPVAQRAAATAMVLDWAGLGSGDRAREVIRVHGTPRKDAALDRGVEVERHRGLTLP